MPFGNQVSRGSGDIADRRPPALESILRQPGVAISGRAAVIRLDHGIAARGEELRQPVEAPFVARAWSAMRKDHCRQALAALPGGSVR